MMTVKPFFSVIITVNNRSHISRAINSVLHQKLTSFELLIVLNNSMNITIGELNKFNDSRIKLFKEKTAGLFDYSATNLAIKEASAEWITFIDINDEWSSEHLNEMNKLIRKYLDVSIVSTSWKITDTTEGIEKANFFRKKNRGKNSRIIHYLEFLHLSASGVNPFCNSAVSIKKKTLLNIGCLSEGEPNVNTWLRAMAYSKTAAWSAILTVSCSKVSTNNIVKQESFIEQINLSIVNKLVSNESNTQFKIELIKFSNAILINNRIRGILTGTHNEVFFKKLSIQHLAPKQILLVILSFLPKVIFRLIFNTAIQIKTIFSKIKKSRATLNRISGLVYLLSIMRVLRDYMYYVLTMPKVNIAPNFESKFIDFKTSTFFGYYDVSPFHSKNSDHILIHSTNAKPFLPPDNSKPCNLQIVDWKKNSVMKKIDTTFAWNWQQGCRLGWVNNENVIYNVYENGNYYAKIFNTQNETKKLLKYPAMAWYKDKLYCAVDFIALSKRNKDYGYNSHKSDIDSKIDFGIAILDQEGSEIIWKMDLDEALLKTNNAKKHAIEKTYFFNHPMFSSDGNKMLFLFRFIIKFRKYHYTFCWNRQNNRADLILKEKVSHYSWIDNNRFIYWGTHAGIDGYHVVDLSNKNVKIVNDTLSDGHPSKLSNKKFIIDSYVFPFTGRVINCLNIENGKHDRIATIAESPSWSYVSRCDPHPFFNSKGNLIQIDTMLGGKRRILIIKKKNS